MSFLASILSLFTDNGGISISRLIAVACGALLLCVLLTFWIYKQSAESKIHDLTETNIALRTDLGQAVAANAITNATLARIDANVKQIGEKTTTLNQGVADLAIATQRGITGVRREIANAKTINLADALPGNIAESLCVQYHKANSRSALRGAAVPESLFLLPADDFAKRCRTAWGKVTWGDIVEWIFPLMEHDGGLQLKLDAGSAYYAPKGNAAVSEGQ